MPEGERAELIDGQLYVMEMPTRIHQKLLVELLTALGSYICFKNGECEVYPAPFAVNLDAEDKNWVEPDISVICDTRKLKDRGCSGAPDFIIEVVSPGTQSMDYFRKLFLYRESGVREYWIVNPATQTVNVYDFEGNDSAAYSFKDSVPVEIYQRDLTVCIEELLK